MTRQSTEIARRLRRAMTPAERRLWARLRNSQLRGAKFRRQVPVGLFVVDFACIGAKLIVEVDGSQHSIEADSARTEVLESAGFLVIRFSNDEAIRDTDGVVGRITAILDGRG